MLTEEEMREYIREEVTPWWEAIKDEMPDLPDVHKARILVAVIRDPFYWKDERDKGEKPAPAKKKEEKTAGQETLEGDVKPDEKAKAPKMIGVKVTGKGTFNNKTTLKKYKLQWDKAGGWWAGNLDPETFEDFKEWAEKHDMKVESVPI